MIRDAWNAVLKHLEHHLNTFGTDEITTSQLQKAIGTAYILDVTFSSYSIYLHILVTNQLQIFLDFHIH